MSPAAEEATLVETEAGLAEVVERASSADAYAIDTEFHRERTYWPRLALVQLAWRDGIALVDPLKVSLEPLAELIASPAVAVAHAADQDLEVLERATGATPVTLFDTQIAAGFVGFSSPSLTVLAERLVGVRLPKGDRLTDWTRRPLTREQLRYAAADVAHLLDIRDVLVERLDKRGRLSWAEDECAALLARARAPQDPETAWWRLKDSRSLKGAARRVAQAVAAWRERRAAEIDVPPRFVLSDLAILGIAHKRPATRDELLETRGLDGRQLRGTTVAELVRVIEDALALPDEAVRVPPTEEVDRTMRPAVTLVSAWVAQLARNMEIDAALLATRGDVQSLLRAEPGARLATGWRQEIVGLPVRRLVTGDAALAFDGDALVLEERSHRRVGPA